MHNDWVQPGGAGFTDIIMYYTMRKTIYFQTFTAFLVNAKRFFLLLKILTSWLNCFSGRFSAHNALSLFSRHLLFSALAEIFLLWSFVGVTKNVTPY